MDGQLTLLSSDNQRFAVPTGVIAPSCKTIRNLLDDIDDVATAVIPLPNVSGNILAMVIEYCNGTSDFPEGSTVDKEGFEKRFKEGLTEQSDLFDLIMAANYLDLRPLLDLTCQMVADMIKGKTTEELRQTFDITNDFTPEEEERVRRQNEWAYDS